jgi:hypothetical protein
VATQEVLVIFSYLAIGFVSIALAMAMLAWMVERKE